MPKQLTASEIRTLFLEFFREHGHEIVASSSLVPKDDPTLLFTNAGMVQFKDVFTGKARLNYSRAATSQKCVRAGGKHNDLENVGKTARHHTFFEMLGNFSFGDYFKREAIQLAWDFLTVKLALSPDRLWATVFREDDEAADLWQGVIGLPPERIVRMGEKDNFWSMGDTGPCGPCSEIIFDRGPEFRCDAPQCGIGKCDCDRWLEIWNLVFMQYERDDSGTFAPLPRPSIDTGMGLERIASVIQGVPTNFDTDLFTPYIKRIEDISGKRYTRGPEGFPFRVIADHIRAATFLVSDGVMPSNEGRGYVLRRIIRRAVRFGRVLGLDRPFLYGLCSTVSEVMGSAYPELHERLSFVEQVIRVEEERFLETLDQGMRRLEALIGEIKNQGKGVISGQEGFVLYDTYGFPPDLLQDVADEEGLAFDRSGFEEALEGQRRRARADREEKMEAVGAGGLEKAIADLPSTMFFGYETLRFQANVLAVFSLPGGDKETAGREEGARRVSAASMGDRVAVVLDQTPFYAESGGQVGDSGLLRGDNPHVRVDIEDTKPFGRGISVHFGVVKEGLLEEGRQVYAEVDAARRAAIARNHTATHLLHKALKEVLGEHVNQAGSLVAPDRIRFDFTHFHPVTEEEIESIEDIVNRQILAATPVETTEMPLDEARAMGAMALFGEKYGDVVRVVRAGNFSLELCGGTHLKNTSEAGLFKLIAQESVGAGVRRIEAVTGLGVLTQVRQQQNELRRAADLLRCSPTEVADRVATLFEDIKERDKTIQNLINKIINDKSETLAGDAEHVGDFRIVSAESPVPDADALRQLGDQIKARLGSAVIILGARQNGKVFFLSMVTPDLVSRGLHAGKIVKEVASIAGGGGGGRPDMAQAGGKDPSRLADALAAGVRVAKQMAGLDLAE